MPIRTDKPDLDRFINKTDTPKQPKREGQGDKVFPLRLPHDLWYELKLKALGEGKSLHEYILQTLRNRKGL